MEENRLVEERIRKLKEIRAVDVDPYPYSYDVKDKALEINEKYSKLKKEQHTKDKVSVAGRIMQLRRMGRVTFMHLQDQSGRIQLYFRENDVGKKNYKFLKKLDIGDIIGVKGEIFKTKTGEVTVDVRKYSLLCKTLRPLPEKFHGLKDEELRYRQRSMDLIMNPEIKEVFVMRNKIMNAIREFMNSQGFLEVDTPTLQPIYGGAEAKPFKTHINAWNMDLFLQISPELYLKRLMVGGYEKVYTICKNFRNEGVDKTHNPEFSMMEFYQAYVDYNEMMKLTENLFEFVAKKVLGTTKIEYQGKKIDLKAPWKKLTVKDAIKKFTDIGDVDRLDDDALKKLLKENNIEYEVSFSRGMAIALLFEELCEEKLIQPTFIIDYPKEVSPLCKAKRKDDALIEKVEPYINGWEIGNGYSELNDPIVQRKLLESQAKNLRKGMEESHPMDEDFVKAIEIGLPPAGGMGIGIDRMVILLTNQPSLRDVLFFPTMRPENVNK